MRLCRLKAASARNRGSVTEFGGFFGLLWGALIDYGEHFCAPFFYAASHGVLSETTPQPRATAYFAVSQRKRFCEDTVLILKSRGVVTLNRFPQQKQLSVKCAAGSAGALCTSVCLRSHGSFFNMTKPSSDIPTRRLATLRHIELP